MQILPIVLMLAFLLTVLTTEKLGQFVDQQILQEQYSYFFDFRINADWNIRQRRLFKQYLPNHRELPIRLLLDLRHRQEHPHETAQIKTILSGLIHELYGRAQFFRSLEEQKGDFVPELIEQLISAGEVWENNKLKRIEEIVHLKLEDPDLQNAFYHMLKGTVSHQDWTLAVETKNWSEHQWEKGYVSLLTYINFDRPIKIKVQRASRSLLNVLFQDEETVTKVLTQRNVLGKEGEQESFREEFQPKLRQGIDPKIIDFSLSTTSKNQYD